jgi:hypothetical protein
VSYRLLDETLLAREIAEMRTLIEQTYRHLDITQDLGIGMMLRMTHFFPEEDWAVVQRVRGLTTLDRMWQAEGYFAREPYLPQMRFVLPITVSRWLAGGRHAGPGRAAQHLFRNLSFRRRI